MKTRVITAALMIILLVPFMFIETLFGYRLPIELLGGLAVVVATNEFIKLTKDTPIYYGVNVLVYGVFVRFVSPNFHAEILLVLKGAIILFILFALYIVAYDKRMHRWFNPIINVFYIGVGVANLVVINHTSYQFLIYLLLVITMTDTFAYLFGVKFGKHRLAPTISPKKSVEGAVAGAVFGTLFGVAYYYVFNLDFPMLFNRSLGFLAIMSLSISVVGQMGDLFASKIKRHFGIKDFGTIFPGHGGVLDRFDSLLLSSLIFMLLVY